jgi:molybdopterin-dependent oxidoreductase alpha subunit
MLDPGAMAMSEDAPGATPAGRQSEEADSARPIEARTPRLPEALEVGAAATSAAGVPAVISTLRHVVREAGFVRGVKLLRALNQAQGFDCQSCAWPNPKDRHLAEFCENGAKAAADEATRARVDPAFFAAHSLSELSEQSDHWLGKQGRITHPMWRRAGAAHYELCTWEQAFALIAHELRALASPHEALFYTSGRTSNEAAFVYQLFVRMFGTNNLPDCSNMCHESSGIALIESIGIGKGTVTLEDFEHADAIFVLGQNPGTNHPRMLTALQAAKRRGATIVSINPLPEAGLQRFKNPQEVLNVLGGGTRLCDLFLQVRLAGDMALLQGIMKELLAREHAHGNVLDQAFIAQKTTGFEQLAAALEALSFEELERESGITQAQMREAAGIYARAKSVICCWAMGLTQHAQAVATIQEVVNLLLLRGNIGRSGAGVCPVRGHSNVQGDRTMGIWERPPAAFLDRLGQRFSFAPPRAPGLDVVDGIRALSEGRAKLLFALGGNFLSATPDTDFTAAALQRSRLTVHVSTKLNRAHLVTGREALILPCLGRSERDLQASGEQFVTVEDSMGIISPSRGVFEPASPELRSEVFIVTHLASATLAARDGEMFAALCDDYDRIRAHIEAVIPGFEDFNRRIRTGPFSLPNPAREGVFETASGKATFIAHALPRLELGPDELVMMTIRSHDQFNTTIYGLDDRYRGIYGGRRVIFMHADDLVARGLAEGDKVDITSHFRGATRSAVAFSVVPFSLPRGTTATYFPEANVLVPLDSVAERSNTPTSKYVRIKVTRSQIS